MMWKDKEGKRKAVKNMSDNHLVNTIRFLNRRGNTLRLDIELSIYQAYSVLNGEMALQSVEQEEHLLNETTDEELVEEKYPIIVEMKEEAEKRGLEIKTIPRDEMLSVANSMMEYGGSFVESLGKALLQADENNQQKIKNAFPEYWERYKK